MTDLSKTNVRNLSVAVHYSRNRVSFCWKFFGDLVLLEGNKKKIVNPDQLYCSVCLNAVKTESEDVNNFGSVKIKSYNKTVSTGNLTRHLRDDHQIQDDQIDIEKVTVKEEIIDFIHTTRNTKSARKSKKPANRDKRILARDLALWCCKSLIPFDSISEEGMADFFKKYNIILNEDELPSRYDVSHTALDEVYECMLSIVKDNIRQDAAQHLALTFDVWKDQYRRTNYITFSLHYLTSDFVYKYLTLSTQMVEENITEEKIGDMIKNLKNTFELHDKKIHAVTDARANVRQAVSSANMDHHLCLGHGFHNLLTADGIKTVPEIEALVTKCKNIVKAISYHLPELESDAKKIQKEFIVSLDSVIENLEGDESNPIPESVLIDIEIKEEDDQEMEVNAISLLGKNNCIPLNESATPTRWHTVLGMLESLMHVKCDRINKMLKKIKRNDLTLTQPEWNFLKDLVTFLEKFREAVEVMWSQKTCTINLALLFRSEIIDVLNSVPDDESLIMAQLKGYMLANIDKRFPVTEAVVAAALLDNRFMNLMAVDTYMASNNMAKTSFLAVYIKEVIGTMTSDETPLETVDPLASTSTSSNDMSLINKLCMKHRINACTDDPIEQECWRYLASADPTAPKDGDLLSYWNSNKNVFPWLAALARAVLCVPATSIPSDRVFSTAGLEIAAKRSRLSPIQINKIIFVHDNYKELKTMTNTK